MRRPSREYAISSEHLEWRIHRPIVGLIAAVLWLLPTAGMSDTAVTVPESQATIERTANTDAFEGTWELDRERSDAPGPMLEAIDAPWWARMLGKHAGTTLVVVEKDGGLMVTRYNPLGSRDDWLAGDGVVRAGSDQLGRPYRESSHWDQDGSLRTERELELGESRTARITYTWHRVGDSLVNAVRVTRDDRSPVTAKRVFAKQQD